MKVYINKELLSIDKIVPEQPFYQGAHLTNKIRLLFTEVASGWTPAMHFLLPNGRRVGPLFASALEAGESHTLVENDVTYYVYDYNLDALILATPGLLQMTVTINYADDTGEVFMRKVNGNLVNKIIKTSVRDGGNVLILGEDPNEVILNIGNNIEKLNNRVTILENTSTVEKALTAESAVKDGKGNVISDTYLPKSGGTMTGNLGLGDNKLSMGSTGVIAFYYDDGFVFKSHVEAAHNPYKFKIIGNSTYEYAFPKKTGTLQLQELSVNLAPYNNYAFSTVEEALTWVVNSINYWKKGEEAIPKAQKDSEGNRIVDTYVTKTELSNLTLDATKVDTSVCDHPYGHLLSNWDDKYTLKSVLEMIDLNFETLFTLINDIKNSNS